VLTDREFEVAVLVASGFTDPEIAATLGISRRTAESHVRSVLYRLNTTRRTQIAAHVGALAMLVLAAP
jgi:DNA-binding NarL/FixJ family response regulator